MKKLVLSLIWIFISILLFSKPVFETKLINTFSAKEVAFDPSFTEICVADTIIIVLDTADSTQIKTFCYDYQGNSIDAFHLPVDYTRRQPLLFRYLYGKKQIAMSSYEGINLFSIQGKLMNQLRTLDDSTYFSPDGVYGDAVDYDSTMYYRYWRILEAGMPNNEIITTSMTWYREYEGKLWPLRKISFERTGNKAGFFSWGFLLDTNKDSQMAMVEEKKDSYLLRFFAGTGERKSTIKRHRNDHLNQLFTGQNFVIINTVNNAWKPTATAAVYDTLGHKITGLFILLKENFNKSGIVDIIGNRLITCNYNDKTISVYEVALKEE